MLSIGAGGLGDVGDVKVKGSIIGSTGDFSRGILASVGVMQGNVKSITVGGSILGYTGHFGDPNDSYFRLAQLFFGKIGSLKVIGDIIGGTGIESGKINAQGGMGDATVGGSVIHGQFRVFGGSLGKVKIAGDLSDSRIFAIENIASLTIGGSVSRSDIIADDLLGAVTIKGNVFASDITSTGQLTPTATADIAIKSVSIGGSAEQLVIRAGHKPNSGTSTNPDAQIGAVKVGGDWIASSIAAGVQYRSTGYGDGTDVKIAGDTQPLIFSRVASVTIAGSIFGTSSPTIDHFGFVAEQIGAFKVAGTALKLTAGVTDAPVDFSLPTGSDVTVREL